MPKQQLTITVQNNNPEHVLAVAFQTFKTLGWPVHFATQDRLLGNTSANGGSKGQQVIVAVEGSSLLVESEMVNGESFDLTGRNKKNIRAFSDAFKNIEPGIVPENIISNTDAINAIRRETIVAEEQQQKEAEEVSKAMNLAGSNLYATYAIIGINLLVFILMIFDGAGIIDVNGLVHVKWGSNLSGLTLSGDWWRLGTNIFIHFGIIHVLFNMYALYMVGIYLEPMLGKKKYIIAYLCTGVLASLTSLWWHKEGTNSAGASGAIFGMYGLFLALLTTDLIPKKVRESLLKSIGIFVLYNLAYGLKSGIDNAAHAGGLVSGFIIGYLYVIMIKAEKKERPANWVIPLIVIATIGISFAFLDAKKLSPSENEKLKAELKSESFKDNDQFVAKANEFFKLEEKALAVLSDTATTDIQKRTALDNVSLPAWEQSEKLLMQMQQMDVSPSQHIKADGLLQYILLRKREIPAMKAVMDNDPRGVDSLNVIRTKMNEVLDRLK